MTTVPKDSELTKWPTERIRELVWRWFQKRPCWYQVEVAKAVYAGKDVLGCTPTGAGKTLSFWIPLLMAMEDGQDPVVIVVSPLNVLAKQNIQVLLDAGISAIAVTAENSNAQTFKKIKGGEYHVIVTNPEILMTNGDFSRLWKTPAFTTRLLAFIFDEGHCIAQWGSFRKNYLSVGLLRYLIPTPVPFYVASATLPPPILNETRHLLHMPRNNTVKMLHSNDRPDIRLMVRQLTYPANSYKDLDFLFPFNWKNGMSTPDKFLVFFDNIKEAEEATKYLRSRLQKDFHGRIDWFHSTMSQEYRELAVERLRLGDVWGLLCTDAFGMGMDIGDIQVVVQFKATCEFCTLWQRFGRAARKPGSEGVAILLVEEKDIHGAKRNTSAKRKMDISLDNASKKKKKCTCGERTFKQEDGIDDIPLEEEEGPSVENSQVLPTPELGAWIAERREHYLRPTVASIDPTTTKKGKNPGVVPGSALDDYINPPTCVNCRRLIPQVYFANNNRTNDSHQRCDPSTPGGCERCQPPPLGICCDLCNPDTFATYSVPLVTTKKSRRAKHPVYIRTSEHEKFEEALYSWRDETANSIFGEDVLAQHGAHLLMDGNVIDSIVDCMSTMRISTLSDLQNETAWPLEWITTCGESLLNVILAHYPLPDDEKSDNVQPLPLQVSSRSRAVVKCGECGNSGHNKRTCPKLRGESVKRRKKVISSNKENEPPPPLLFPSQIPAPSHQPALPIPLTTSVPAPVPAIPSFYQHLLTPSTAMFQPFMPTYHLPPTYPYPPRFPGPSNPQVFTVRPS